MDIKERGVAIRARPRGEFPTIGTALEQKIQGPLLPPAVSDSSLCISLGGTLALVWLHMERELTFWCNLQLCTISIDDCQVSHFLAFRFRIESSHRGLPLHAFWTPRGVREEYLGCLPLQDTSFIDSSLTVEECQFQFGFAHLAGIMV
jgi:hypothetical protein